LVATAIYAFFWTLIMFDWLGGFTGVNFLVVHCWPSVLGPGWGVTAWPAGWWW